MYIGNLFLLLNIYIEHTPKKKKQVYENIQQHSLEIQKCVKYRKETLIVRPSRFLRIYETFENGEHAKGYRNIQKKCNNLYNN